MYFLTEAQIRLDKGIFIGEKLNASCQSDVCLFASLPVGKQCNIKKLSLLFVHDVLLPMLTTGINRNRVDVQLKMVHHLRTYSKAHDLLGLSLKYQEVLNIEDYVFLLLQLLIFLQPPIILYISRTDFIS